MPEQCICGPDHTGEAPDDRPDCPACNPPTPEWRREIATTLRNAATSHRTNPSIIQMGDTEADMIACHVQEEIRRVLGRNGSTAADRLCTELRTAILTRIADDLDQEDTP